MKGSAAHEGSWRRPSRSDGLVEAGGGGHANESEVEPQASSLLLPSRDSHPRMPIPSPRRSSSATMTSPRGGSAPQSASHPPTSALAPGQVRRYCLYGLLLCMGVMCAHLIETSPTLERSTLLAMRSPGATTTSSSLSARARGGRSSRQTTRSSRRGESNSEDDEQCTVWMAPSSLPGESSGFGIFVTRPLKAGESILGGPDGVGIPISTYHRNDAPEPNAAAAKRFRRFFYEYAWARGMPDHVLYDAPPHVVDYQTGLGSLPNHHCVLSHLHTRYPERGPYDDSLANRFKDPTAGSFSYNRGRDFYVDHDLEAGDEVFLSYGLCDPNVRKAGTWMDELFVTSDYASAASIVLRARYNESDSSAELSFHASTGVAQVSSRLDRHVAALLPQNRKEFRSIVNAADNRGGGFDEVVRQVALHKLNRRTPEWIRQHGVCLGNLAGHPSTVPAAGLGAFAQRTIRRGEMVVPAPLLHILDKEAMKIYSRSGKHVETQLLLNYCFGHPQSSVLLCPNTNAVLINHCSHRTKDCGPRGPNAEYRWATTWDRTTPVWLNLTLEELSEKSGHGLSLEIVATREIKPGEEVFIDYGVEWEQAWKKHVESWTPPPLPSSRPGWLTARDANDNKGPIPDELVAGDLRARVSHPYLFTGCQYWNTSRDEDERYARTPPKGGWRSMSDEEILDACSEPAREYTDNRSGRRSYERHRDRSHWPCTVLRRESNDTYTVRIHVPFFAETTLWEKNQLPRILTNYSRESIHFFVLPYAGDQHLSGVFRHEIGIRDDIFPDHWKNLATITTTIQ